MRYEVNNAERFVAKNLIKVHECFGFGVEMIAENSNTLVVSINDDTVDTNMVNEWIHIKIKENRASP